MPENAREQLREAGGAAHPAGPSRAVGNPKSVNVVLLGALATRLDFPTRCGRSVSERVPQKTVDANLAPCAAASFAERREE